MQVQVNGEAMVFEPGDTLGILLEKLSLDIRKIAIEKNLEVVPQSQYAATVLQSGDRLEIIQFIGGG